MNILIINAGSSSLKFQYINPDTEEILIKGHYDGLNRTDGKSCLRILTIGSKTTQETEIKTHRQAIEDMLSVLLEKKIVENLSDISSIGHRVVHGAEEYSKTTEITDTMLLHLKKISFLAPLHNPVNIECIEILKEKLPQARHFAVFDTAFHQTIPERIYLYGLPKELYDKFKIRKYGFHGISHQYVSKKAADILGKDYNSLKLITCHLGNGQSICAINQGKSFDNSMGFTPVDGLPMGTRSGSFDPEIVLFLLEHGYSKEQIKKIINKESGLFGISQISSDHRQIEDLSIAGDKKAKLANDILTTRIVSIIGSYIAEMNGVDAIIFTGGIGEKSAYLRELVLEHFTYLGLEIDKEANQKHNVFFSTKNSKVIAMVVPTNEELEIAIETKKNL
ncbi:MAG TPA: acetate kinase [Candidatus Diapherotrites archaeon]|nr:acetate kinase [Candidatus Diapherotrites archaeon]